MTYLKIFAFANSFWVFAMGPSSILIRTFEAPTNLTICPFLSSKQSFLTPDFVRTMSPVSNVAAAVPSGRVARLCSELPVPLI